jgi:hypothetical protein
MMWVMKSDRWKRHLSICQTEQIKHQSEGDINILGGSIFAGLLCRDFCSP